MHILPYFFVGQNNAVSVSYLLSQLSVQPAAAYSLRKLSIGYTGSAIRVRRSTDQSETDIGFATAIQTRTNLDPVPATDGDSRTSAGITRTVVGTGTEFGQSYIDIRWNGTATATVNLRYCSTPLTASPNSTTNALVTTGQTVTCSMGYRLVAGTFPAVTARLTQFFRNGTSLAGEANSTLPSLPTATLQRSAVTSVVPATTNYVQNIFQMDGSIGLVCDFTMRFYAPNTELGTGNAQPLLQRNTPEVIANIDDLDAELLLTFVSGNNGFVTAMHDQVPKLQNLLLRSEELDNVVWDKTGYTVIANDTIAPNGTLTADKLIDSGGSTFFAQSVIIPVNSLNTHSFYLKKINHDWVRISIASGGNQVNLWGNVSNGTIGVSNTVGTSTNISVAVSDVGGGWYRFSISGLIPTVTSVSVFICSATSNGSGTRVVGGERYQWGGQVNAGATATGYIKTEGTNSPVTNYNAVQTTAANQPRIVNGGAIVTENFKPTVLNTATTGLGVTGLTSLPTTNSVSVVVSNTGTAGRVVSLRATNPLNPLLDYTTATNIRYLVRDDSSVNTIVLNQTVVALSLNVLTAIRNVNTGSLSVNGNAITGSATPSAIGTTTTTTGMGIGCELVPSFSLALTGSLSEVVIFSSALSTTDRQTLERNQGTYYGITVA